MKKCRRQLNKVNYSMSLAPVASIGTLISKSFHQDATIKEETSEEIRKYF